MSPSSPAAARKGNGDGDGFGLDSARVELNWSVVKLLGWLDGAMWGCGGRSARARSRRPWRTVEGGRRRGNHATTGVLGPFIGERSPGRGERRLGAVDLVLGDSTAGWRSGQRRCAWRGGVSAREGARDACWRGEVPRGRPGSPGPPAAYGGRRAKQSKPGGERWR